MRSGASVAILNPVAIAMRERSDQQPMKNDRAIVGFLLRILRPTHTPKK